MSDYTQLVALILISLLSYLIFLLLLLYPTPFILVLYVSLSYNSS